MAKAKEVEVAAIERAKKHLEKMTKKEPNTKTLVEALDELKPLIVETIGKGYSRDEVVAMLAEKGIEAKAYHLKKLLAKAKD